MRRCSPQLASLASFSVRQAKDFTGRENGSTWNQSLSAAQSFWPRSLSFVRITGSSLSAAIEPSLSTPLAQAVSVVDHAPTSQFAGRRPYTHPTKPPDKGAKRAGTGHHPGSRGRASSGGVQRKGLDAGWRPVSDSADPGAVRALRRDHGHHLADPAAQFDRRGG